MNIARPIKKAFVTAVLAYQFQPRGRRMLFAAIGIPCSPPGMGFMFAGWLMLEFSQTLREALQEQTLQQQRDMEVFDIFRRISAPA